MISTFFPPRSSSKPPGTVLCSKATWEGWIICCSRRFFPLARRVAGDDSLAGDVLQTSWIKILQSINHACFEGPKACPWVHEIVANTAENIRRQRVQRGEVASLEEVDLHPGPQALAQEKELLALLAEMIQMLPGTYRQIFDLRLYQGLSTLQTAERLHISRSSVSTRLSRAVRLPQRPPRCALAVVISRRLPTVLNAPLEKKVVTNRRFDCLRGRGAKNRVPQGKP